MRGFMMMMAGVGFEMGVAKMSASEEALSLPASRDGMRLVVGGAGTLSGPTPSLGVASTTGLRVVPVVDHRATR